MATRKRSGGGAAGGWKGGALTVVMLILIAAVGVAWWNANGFTSLNDAIDWIRAKSNQVDACVDSNLPDGEAGKDVRNLVNAHNCILPGLGDETPNLQEIDLDLNTKEGVLALVNALDVAPAENVDYKRSDWRHWSDLDKNGCDSREDLLKHDGIDVKTDPKTCKALSGSWTELYSNTTTTNPSSLDVDHVVPLSYAAQHGGQEWTNDVKEQFANDVENLRLASASENRSKGDKGPKDYLPENEDFLCVYSKQFALVIHTYGLTVDQGDKTALLQTVEAYCPEVIE